MTGAIRDATPLDWPLVRNLLLGADLPVEDLSTDRMSDFLVYVDAGGILAGAIGLEAHGQVALLRSLVVGDRVRGLGLGRRLVAALEDRARRAGLRELWLLTNDADGYFADLDYETAERAAAPDAIRGSAEFSSICPASAILMKKTLR